MKTGSVLNQKVLFQYMIRYGIVVLIITCLMWGLMNWILRQYRESLMLNTREEIVESLWELDAFFETQQNVAREIYLNKLSKPGYMLGNSVNAHEGVEQIKLYQTSMEVNDYILVSYENGELFTQDGNVSLENMLNRVLQLDDGSQVFFLDAIHNHQKATFGSITNRQGGEMLLFFYPMLNHLTDADDMIGFVVSGISLRKYLQEELSRESMFAVMLSEDGNILFEYNGLEGVTEKDAELLRKQLLEDREHLQDDYTYCSYEAENGFSFYCVFQDNMVLREFNSMIVRVLLFGILIFIFAVVLISVINWANALRIEKVRDELLLCNGGNLVEADKNEFLQIQYLISKMYQEQKKATVVREQIARIVCGGMIEQEEVLNILVHNACPDFQGSSYVILSVAANENAELLRFILNKKMSHGISIAEKYHETTVLSYVIGLQDVDLDSKKRKELAQTIIKEINGSGITDTFVTTGRICRQLCEISSAYQSMLSMIYYQLTSIQTKTERIFLFEEVVEKSIDIFFTEEVQNLKQAFKDKNTDTAILILQKMIQKTDACDNNMIQSFRRCMLTELLYRLLTEAGADAQQSNRIRSVPLEDGAAFFKEVTSIVRKVLVDIEIPIETIMNYIDTHYKDSSLGLDALASHFRMSVSAVSRYIKEQNGQKYSEYISNLRMQEACRLLLETDIKLQEIPYEIGYHDYTSFSKKFKSVFNMSPSEYRAKRKQ